MAQLEDDASTSMLEGGETHSEETSQLVKIHGLIKIHDCDYKISYQINQCMIADGLTFEILAYFDERSLSETIDSWKIDTFGKKCLLFEDY